VQHRDPKTEEGKEEIAAETLTPSSIAKAGFPREHLVSSEGNVIHGPSSNSSAGTWRRDAGNRYVGTWCALVEGS